MEIYQYAVMLHIAASLGIFAGWGMEISAIRRLRRVAKAKHIKENIDELNKATKLSMASMLITFIAGVYLMITAWGQKAWIAGGILALLFLIVSGIVLTRRAMPMLKSMSQKNEHFYIPAYMTRIRYLMLSIRIKIITGLAIVALMVLKPETNGTLLLLLLLSVLIALIVLVPGKKRTLQNIQPHQ